MPPDANYFAYILFAYKTYLLAFFLLAFLETPTLEALWQYV